MNRRGFRVLAAALVIALLSLAAVPSQTVGRDGGPPAAIAVGAPAGPAPAATGTTTGAVPWPATGPAYTWANLSTRGAGTGPHPRMDASVAYDPQFGGEIVFGGIYDPTRTYPMPAFNDTWLFANGTWSNLTGSLGAAPPARWGASFVWDPVDNYTLLFGGNTGGTGSGGGGFLNDTWALTRAGWSEVSAANPPSPRGFAPVAYDPDLGAILLFTGGDIDFSNGTIQAYHDTWTYVGGVWTNVTATAGAGAGQASALAYDPQAGGVIATGIMKPDSVCAPLNQTWLFANGTWTRLLNNSSPIPGGTLVYDASLGALVYVGGCLQSNHTPIPLTWTYANGTWTNLTGQLTALQGAVCCTGMAYDPGLKLDVLFGGNRVHPTVQGGYVAWTYSFPYAPLSATVHATRAIGSAPFTASLQSSPTGGDAAYAYAWSFGDGSLNATTRNATHTFTTPGTYTVQYGVVDGMGRSFNASLVITVGPTLVATAEALPATGEAPLTVTFNGSAVGGYGPYSYAWNFSDGAIAVGANGTHVYTGGGTFLAQLTATDSVGDTSYDNATVSVASALTATVGRTPTVGVAPLLVSFAATPTGGLGPYSYGWQFGDGTTAAGATATHRYATPGAYSASVNVTDSYGRSVVLRANVTAVAALTAAASGGPTAGGAPLTVAFTGTPHGGLGPFTYAWTFGDGGSGTGALPSHAYTSPGNYTATVAVSDALNETATASVVVEVAEPLVVAVPAGLAGIAPATFTFLPSIGGGLAPYSINWTFGDGGLGVGPSIRHTYPGAGTYTATVSVTDAVGQRATNATVVTVVSPLSATLSSVPDAVGVGYTATFTATASHGLGPFTYVWDGLPAGAGCSSANTSSLSCTPSSTGTFTIHVHVHDVLGEVANASATLTVSSSGSTTGGGPGSLSTTEWELLAAIVVTVAFIGVLAFLLFRSVPRRRPPAPTAPAAGKDPGGGRASDRPR
jgi:PKD repeat protein